MSARNLVGRKLPSPTLMSLSGHKTMDDVLFQSADARRHTTIGTPYRVSFGMSVNDIIDDIFEREQRARRARAAAREQRYATAVQDDAPYTPHIDESDADSLAASPLVGHWAAVDVDAPSDVRLHLRSDGTCQLLASCWQDDTEAAALDSAGEWSVVLPSEGCGSCLACLPCCRARVRLRVDGCEARGGGGASLPWRRAAVRPGTVLNGWLCVELPDADASKEKEPLSLYLRVAVGGREYELRKQQDAGWKERCAMAQLTPPKPRFEKLASSSTVVHKRAQDGWKAWLSWD